MASFEKTSPLSAGPGGVFTDEEGVVSGALELRTTADADGAVTNTVRYAGADDWYAVRGTGCRVADPADAEAVHTALLGVLHRPEG
jgi:hypothetical protein